MKNRYADHQVPKEGEAMPTNQTSKHPHTEERAGSKNTRNTSVTYTMEFNLYFAAGLQ